MTEKTRQLLPSLSLLSAMLLWASSFVATKLAFAAYHPMQVMFARMLLASLCFVAFIPAFRKIKVRKSDLKYLMLMCLCEPCLYFLLEAQALKLTSASQAGMITAMLPLMVAILAWKWLKEDISPRTVFGFFVAILGACWLTLAGGATTNAPNPLLGNLCEFLAMVCAAFYMILIKRLTYSLPPLFLTAFQSFVGSLFFFPFLLHPAVGWDVSWERIPGLAVIYLGTAVTFGAYACYNYGASRVPANRAAGYVNLIPVFCVILGMVILGDRLNLAQWLACGVVFCGVWLSSATRTTVESALPTSS